ncbi:MAG: hypothetical protein IJ246_11310 [Clostridia bacterium]|nr:hypothetical protein [Clostridia bacterium]
MDHISFIFVHGLSGWGSYDKAYANLPYWGMRGGDLMAFLRSHGFSAYAASVSPTGSAWDRACELYAQINGVRVDYGKHHSETLGHPRYGRDFTDCPLLPAHEKNGPYVLLGHSFGGATVRMLSTLLAIGSREEQEATHDGSLSPLFRGGMSDRVRALVALASPLNGTTAYQLSHDPAFDPSSVSVPLKNRLLARLMSRRNRGKENPMDCAAHDMHIDEARALNAKMPTLSSVYYFSVPCSDTYEAPDGTWRPRKGMEPLFVMRASQIGAYTGQTAGGIHLDQSWQENDGLVNTLSSQSPYGAPSCPLEPSHIVPGIWNVYPVFAGDHMALQGGLMRRHDIRAFYLNMLTMICSLPPKP